MKRLTSKTSVGLICLLVIAAAVLSADPPWPIEGCPHVPLAVKVENFFLGVFGLPPVVPACTAPCCSATGSW